MRNFLRIPIFCCIAVVMVATAAAQPAIPPPHERPDYWTVVQDSMIAGLYDGVKVHPANEISGSYQFSMLYDSSCRTDYVFTEPWLNGQRLTLDRWVNGRSVNADQEILSFNSRTKPFWAKAGDTVRFYREIDWISTITWRKDTISYLSRDTLGFSVELIRSYDMSRILLLDSIGIMPQDPPGKIRFYSPHNAMAAVECVLPEWIGADSLCIRVRVRARGSGEYYFTRQDDIRSGYSRSAMSHPILLADQAILKECCWTPIALPEQEPPLERMLLRAALEGNTGGERMLTVRQEKAGDADVTIGIVPPPGFGAVSVIVTGGSGGVLRPPFAGPVEGAREATYRFPSSGIYLVGVMSGGKIIDAAKITVTR